VSVVAVVVATLAGGIALDAHGPSWAQAAVSAWTWTVFVWVLEQSESRHRVELVVCLVLATFGEIFLKDVWGLYVYRLDNLPLFVPPGHAIVFASAVRLSRLAPRWFPAAVVAPLGLYLAYAGWKGFDTQGMLWFLVFLACLAWSSDRRLCSVLFVFALLIEGYGTTLGGWHYFARDPWFGLTTTDPPVGIGAIYCTLERLVRVSATRLSLDAASVARHRRSASASRSLPMLRASVTDKATLVRS
jgi:hypothetical protein